MDPLIAIEGVSKVYPMGGGDVYALRDVSLEVQEAEFVSIVGKSGSGKSTLLYLLGLLTEPTCGEYRLRGRKIDGLSDVECSRVRAREIGFIFQSFHLVPQIRVLENVLLSARYAPDMSQQEARKRARELVERVGLGHRIGHRPTELSNGEMQRVAIARALLTNPSLILADEPTGNLDEETGHEIYELLESLHREGTTIILVTHDAQLASRTGRCIRLKDGEVENGSV